MGTPWYPRIPGGERQFSELFNSGWAGRNGNWGGKHFLDFLGTNGATVPHIDTSMYATNDKIAMPYNVGNGDLVGGGFIRN
jgi:hypothetical protein